jgi:hypothetical protein
MLKEDEQYPMMLWMRWTLFWILETWLIAIFEVSN